MKVTLGIIVSHGFPVPAQFVVGLSGVLQQLLTGAGNAETTADRQITAARILYSYMFPTDAARNEICRLFLDEDNGDYLLFLDADMKHPPNVAHQLIRHGLPLVTGRYTFKKPPFMTVALRKVGDGPWDYKTLEKVESEIRGLMPIDAAGAGVLLIHRSVLEAIRERCGDEWFRYQMNDRGLRGVSEDMWFFEQARACGVQPMLDADVECDHIASFEVNSAWHTPYREMLAQAVGQ